MCGFVNLMGMVGGVILAVAAVEASDLGHAEEGDLLGDLVRWLLGAGVHSRHVKLLGAAALVLAPLLWGYSYSSFLLFLETTDPGCGPADREAVYSRSVWHTHYAWSSSCSSSCTKAIIRCRFSRLKSVSLLLTEVDKVSVIYLLEEWRQEMSSSLHCLVSSKEGAKLADSIQMFHNIASVRIKYTE